MAKVIFYEIFKQRKERQLAAEKMENRKRRIDKILLYAKECCNWEDDDAEDDS